MNWEGRYLRNTRGKGSATAAALLMAGMQRHGDAPYYRVYSLPLAAAPGALRVACTRWLPVVGSLSRHGVVVNAPPVLFFPVLAGRASVRVLLEGRRRRLLAR